MNTEKIKAVNEALWAKLGWKFDGLDGWTDPAGVYHQALYGRNTDKYMEHIPPNYAGDRNAILALILESIKGDEAKAREFVQSLYSVLDETYEGFGHAAGEPVITTWYLMVSEPWDLARAYTRTLTVPEQPEQPEQQNPKPEPE